VRFAYADPPYIGQAKKHYQCAEIDHAELIGRLCSDYDAWALSLISPTLKAVLAMCPDDVRVMPWVKPFCSFKANVNPAFAWEPVITRGGRKLGRDVPTMRDWVSAGITLERGTHGAKPNEFCFWLFEVMGLTPEDEFHDLYLGSGAVTRAWDQWKNMRPLNFGNPSTCGEQGGLGTH
jgi:hypothetical protein